MAQPIAEALMDASSGNYALFDKFVSTCPDEVWLSDFGGWPIWQQYAHTLWVNVLFLPGEPKPGLLPDLPDDVVQLKAKGGEPLAKDAAKKSLEAIRKATFDYLASLSDGDLPKVAKKLGENEFSNLKITTLLGGHIMYHLGVFDAALRERKLPGII
ncbi:MAG: DinB family protein [Deltaproteobacteria bacterium]|jgi:hypothetical protein|nr:DinB family protein [Deltaproteobacteria bacterium]